MEKRIPIRLKIEKPVKKNDAKTIFQATKLGNWSLDIGKIKSGGQSAVCYVKRDDNTKGVFRCLKSNSDQQAVERFRKEIATLNSLKHKSIISLLEVADDLDSPWYITERGKPFKEYWKQVRIDCSGEPKKLVRKAVVVMRNLCDAMSLCHTRNPPVIHRDIKPDNIIIDGDNVPLLIDFGVVFVGAEDRVTRLEEVAAIPGQFETLIESRR